MREEMGFTELNDRSPTHLQEPHVQGIFSDVQHLWAVDATVVIDLLDDQPVGKGRDVQHVEQRGFTGTHLISRLDQLHITLEREDNVRYTVDNQRIQQPKVTQEFILHN